MVATFFIFYNIITFEGLGTKNMSFAVALTSSTFTVNSHHPSDF